MEQYLKLLDSNAESFLFAAFDYRKQKKPKLFYGKPDELKQQLTQLNKDVFCIYVTVNETAPGTSRKKQDIIRCRAIWIEDDVQVDEPRNDFPIEPSMVVESSPGKYHYYWLTSTTDFAAWNAVMAVMVDEWGCDNNAKDISRVLRVPGFLHRKSLTSKFETRLITSTGAVYDWDEIVASFPPPTLAEFPAAPAPLYKEAEAIAAILDSKNYHNSLTSIALSLSNHGLSREMQLYALRGIMLSIPKDKRRPEWDDRISDEHLYECIDSAVNKVDSEHVDVTESPDIDDEYLAEQQINFPPGLIGVMCQEIKEMAPYENNAIALAGGIGLAAGIVGRRYNALGMGLNIYIALLADSGIGKANLKDAINKALRGRGGNTNAGALFIGRSRFTGPRPVFEMLATGLSRICVLEEAGLMAESRAGDQAGISRVTLDLFTSSGYGKWAGDEGYSKKEDSIPVLPSPALSIIHVSTPKSFLKALRSKSAEVSGEVARLWMLRTIGEKPYLNTNRRVDFSKPIIERIEALIKTCVNMQKPECEEMPVDMKIEQTMYTDANKWVDLENKYLREGDHLRRTLCSRAWAKVVKLAAICSAFNGLNEIGAQEYKWAHETVTSELGFIQNTFTHESTDNLLDVVKSVMFPAILKCLKRQFKVDVKCSPPRLAKKGIFTYTNMSQILFNNVVVHTLDDDPERPNPRTGLDKIIDYMLRSGLLVTVEPNELSMLGCKSKKAYKITNDFQLLMDAYK